MSIDVPELDEPVDGPVHRYTFPPFPQMLPGRELPPFAQFVSKGIRKRTAPDAVEVDGLGIPTVRLRVDEAGKPKKKKKKSKVLAVRDADGRQLPWWEVWDKDEDQRGPDAPYARSMDDTECLIQASADFWSSRTWPANMSMIHVVWTHIRLFIGAETLAGAKNSTFKPSGGDGAAASDDDMDDEDAEFGVTPADGTLRARPASRMSAGGPVSGLEEVGDEFEPSPEEIRAAGFLEDTDYHIRMFFSSYFIDRGLVWNEYKCRDAPKLFAFFLRFVLRNRLVRADAARERLQAALAVCDAADVELSAAFAVGAVMSSVQITEALTGLWGKKWAAEHLYGDGWTVAPPEPTPEEADDVRRTAAPDVLPIDSEEFLADAPAREAIADNLDGEPVIPEDAQPRIVEVPDEDAPAPPAEEPAAPEEADPPRWGTEPPQTKEGRDWASAHMDSPYEWKLPAEDKPAEEEDPWVAYKAITVGELLGPTALPTTHRTGIVEQATRRVKAVLPPVTHAAPGDGTAAGAVEDALRAQFARVLFIPWGAGSDANARRTEGKTDVLPPCTLAASVGRVAPDAPGGHDLERDEIEVLMDVDKADRFIVGMGFTGTWVQIAREDDVGGEPGRLWYVEYVSQFLPSFYVPLLY